VKRLTIALVALLLVVAATQAPHGQGQPSPEQQAALARQEALEKSTPQLQITEEVLKLSVPGHTIGEAVGVSKDSKGHLYVFTRSGNLGPARGATASQLFEFDQNLRFVKQWGQDNYAASFAHNVRVDKYDNVWMTDEGSNMIVKFTPQAMVSMVLGRKPEAIDFLERYLERGERNEVRYPVGGVGTFGRPTDVAFDSKDNIFISDGYANSRVVKVNKDGTWNKAVGTRGAGMNQFNTVHAITSDAKDNIYVADRGNRRIQVYDADLNFPQVDHQRGSAVERLHLPDAEPVSVQRRRQRKDLQAGYEREPRRLGAEQPGHGQTGCLIHELHCESDTVIYKGDCSTWTVEKITIKGSGGAESDSVKNSKSNFQIPRH
jgi:hypothetical protein